MKKVYLGALCLLLAIGFVLPTQVIAIQGNTVTVQDIKDDGLYHIVDHREDGTLDDKLQTASLSNAEQQYESVLKTARNPAIYYQGNILKIRYGIVTFQREATCNYNVNYTNVKNGESGYTNACYGADAAYLSSSTDYQSVDFMISGVEGRASTDNIEIVPLEQATSLSTYEVKDGELYHHLKTSLSSKGYGNTIVLDKAPSYLNEGKKYHSYDGHSFYEAKEIRNMMDDIRSGTDEHAVNKGNPYYNYYQYVSHRTISAYQQNDIDTYLSDVEGLYTQLDSYLDQDEDGLHDIWTQSLLIGSSDAFLEYQNIYGANALMMLALSMNESAMGRSVIGYQKNNVFGHAAFDSSAQESASRYDCVSQSVYSHAKNYISKSYLNPEQYMYHGGFFGNKQSGMNVSYASDPYWGEKAASYMYQMDRKMGLKERNQYTLGIHTSFAPVVVYKRAKADAPVLYETKAMSNMPFVILKTVKNKAGNWYQIQTDPVVKKIEKSEYDYQFSSNVGYIKQADIDQLLAADKKTSQTYYTITFDAVGGTFEDGSKKTKQEVRKGMIPQATAPVKKNMYFTGWSKKTTAATKNTTYSAKYKKIKKVEWIKKPKQAYVVDEQLDVTGGKVRVTFQDKTTQTISLQSDMVYDYRLDTVGKQELKVKVGGASLPYSIQVAASDTKKEAVDQAVTQMIDQYHKSVLLKSEAKQNIKQTKKQINDLGKQFFTITTIRSMDKLFQRAYGDDLKISFQTYDKKISVSGLSILAKNKVKQTHKIALTIKKDGDSKAKQLLKTIASNNHVTIDKTIQLAIVDQKETLTSLDTQVVVSLPKPKDSKKTDQYVLLYSDGKNVIKMPTMQTKNKVIGKVDRTGTFVLAHRSDVNISNVDDVLEVTTTDEESTPWNLILMVSGAIIFLILLLIVMFVYVRKRRAR